MKMISSALRPLALALSLALGAGLMSPQVAVAQNPFEAAVQVDETIVTNYEISQRARFMQVLNAQGDLRQQAIDALINERLQETAGLRLGIVASPEEVEAGLEEFAARADLGAEQFLRQMASEGIAPETVRDFVAAGITWRNIVRSQFGPRVEIDEEDIDIAMELGQVLGGGREILLAEIIIPLTPENRDNLVSELARLGQNLNGDTEQFAEAARRFSAAPTREAGGSTGWRPIAAIPEGMRSLFDNMYVGQVTDPVPLGGGQAYALFQFRGAREVPSPRPTVTAIDYVSVALPGGRSPEALAEAARIRDAVDVCNDLNGVIPHGFERQTVAPGSLPNDVALALRNLDEGEWSTQVTRNDGTVLLALMLCNRELAEPEGGRQAIQQQLFGQALEAYAANYLEQLRAEADIVYLN